MRHGNILGNVVAASCDHRSGHAQEQHVPDGVAAALGPYAEFPEADRAAWFAPEAAVHKIIKGQRAVLEALLRQLGRRRSSDGLPFQSDAPHRAPIALRARTQRL